MESGPGLLLSSLPPCRVEPSASRGCWTLSRSLFNTLTVLVEGEGAYNAVEARSQEEQPWASPPVRVEPTSPQYLPSLNLFASQSWHGRQMRGMIPVENSRITVLISSVFETQHIMRSKVVACLSRYRWCFLRNDMATHGQLNVRVIPACAATFARSTLGAESCKDIPRLLHKCLMIAKPRTV